MTEARTEYWIEWIKSNVKAQNFHFSSHSDEALIAYIDQCICDISQGELLDLSQRLAIRQRVFNFFRRLDIIQPLLDDDRVTEIMVNGPDEIFVEIEGSIVKTEIRFESREKLEQMIQTIVSKVNRQVTERNPIVDARLSDGSRVHVVLFPVALNGPILTIRKFTKEPMTLERLVSLGALTQEAALQLRKMVQAKYNIFISGGTGSGKTSFLNALSQCIPEEERVITIEDSAELQIGSVKNLISLETRDANVEGIGELTIKQLIKASLRMRPDRIIVGEVRGFEALDMLQAMNTGHDGSISTGHGNSTTDMLSRLETMVLSGLQMPLEAIRLQIASAIDILVHLSRFRDNSRRVVQICEMVNFSNGEYRLNSLYEFKENIAESSLDKVVGELKRTSSPLANTDKLLKSGFEEVF